MTAVLTAQSPEVVDFVDAYQENRNLAVSPEWRGNGWRVVIVVAVRRKYLAIDESDAYGDEPPQVDVHRSGRFMVDRADGTVYTIQGYGQRGHRVGDLARLTAEYRAGTATFRPDARAHWETSRSRVASWSVPDVNPAPRPEPATYVTGCDRALCLQHRNSARWAGQTMSVRGFAFEIGRDCADCIDEVERQR